VGAARRRGSAHAAGSLPSRWRGTPPVYAVDVSVWPRSDAETSPERGFYYHPSRHSAGQPIVAGWAYQFIAQIGFARESWVAPVDARRVRPKENTNEVAAGQVTALLDRLPESEGVVPLFVFDASYDPVQLQRGLTGRRAAVLVRLRAGRCFYADPVGPPARTERPRRHGPKLDTKDPETWPTPTAEHHCEDPAYGSVRVRAWTNLHPKIQEHPARGTRRPRPIVRGTLVLVEVSRLPRPTREPRMLWLWWAGPGAPDLDLIWRSYVRRFDLEQIASAPIASKGEVSAVQEKEALAPEEAPSAETEIHVRKAETPTEARWDSEEIRVEEDSRLANLLSTVPLSATGGTLILALGVGALLHRRFGR
jgi:hypothetical protein